MESAKVAAFLGSPWVDILQHKDIVCHSNIQAPEVDKTNHEEEAESPYSTASF